MDASDKSVLTWTPSFVLSTLFLLCGIGLTFAQVIFADFVWDDKNLILNNPWLRQNSTFWATWSNDFWAFSRGGGLSGMYRPIVIDAYWLELKIFGFNPMGFHLVNLLLHTLNSILVLAFCRSLSHSAFTALFAALLFALHPIQVEAVANIASQTDLLATIGVLSALLIWRKPSMRWLSALCMFFALCAKESAIIGPALLYLYTPQKSRLHSIALWLVSPLLLWFALRYHAIGLIQSPQALPWEGASRIYDYIGRIFFPVAQSPIKTIDPYPPILMSCLSLAFLFKLRWIVTGSGNFKKSLLFFFIALAPVSEIIPVGARFSDLLLYLPMVGASLFLAQISTLLLSKVPNRIHQQLLCLVSFTSCLFFSSQRSLHWKDDLSLWTFAVQFPNPSLTTQLNYANALRSNAQRTQGCALLSQIATPSSRPSDRTPMSRVYFNLGNCARESGQWAEAIHAYTKSIELTEGQFFPARLNLIISIDSSGDTATALNLSHQLCLEMPKQTAAWHTYGVMLAKSQQYAEAVSAFQKAIQLDPHRQDSLEYLKQAEQLLSNDPPPKN